MKVNSGPPFSAVNGLPSSTNSIEQRLPLTRRVLRSPALHAGDRRAREQRHPVAGRLLAPGVEPQARRDGGHRSSSGGSSRDRPASADRTHRGRRPPARARGRSPRARAWTQVMGWSRERRPRRAAADAPAGCSTTGWPGPRRRGGPRAWPPGSSATARSCGRARGARWTGAPPTTDTQYRIGSITKTFVAVLVLRLRDEGLLDLADPLEAHLPGTGRRRPDRCCSCCRTPPASRPRPRRPGGSAPTAPSGRRWPRPARRAARRTRGRPPVPLLQPGVRAPRGAGRAAARRARSARCCGRRSWTRSACAGRP